MVSKVLISIASWEDRFSEGVEISLREGGFDAFYCLASSRYQEQTRTNRAAALKACQESRAHCSELIFNFEDQVETYRHLTELAASDAISRATEVVFDLSTAPRSVIWTFLGALRVHRADLSLRYFRAKTYAPWQTEEEGEPKLIINGSGIMYPDLPTCLVMLCGPEISRAEKMFYRFEPRKTLILRDTHADDFGEIKHLGDMQGGVDEMRFDNKDFSDHNVCELERIIAPYVGTFNIVTAAFGPKLGAIVLYRLVERNAEIALSYVTSGRHNLNSTRGIGEVKDTRLVFSPGTQAGFDN